MANGAGLQVFGSLFKAFSNISAGREADEGSEQNALMLNQDAEFAVQDSQDRAFAIQRHGRRFRGTQRASTAARNIVVGTGSSLDLLTESVVNTNLQAADTLRTGQLHKIKLDRQASQQIRSGNVANRAGFIRAGGNILQTGLNLNRQKNAQNTARTGISTK